MDHRFRARLEILQQELALLDEEVRSEHERDRSDEQARFVLECVYTAHAQIIHALRKLADPNYPQDDEGEP